MSLKCAVFYALFYLHESSEMQLLWFQSLSATEKRQIFQEVLSNADVDLNAIKQ